MAVQIPHCKVLGEGHLDLPTPQSEVILLKGLFGKRRWRMSARFRDWEWKHRWCVWRSPGPLTGGSLQWHGCEPESGPFNWVGLWHLLGPTGAGINCADCFGSNQTSNHLLREHSLGAVPGPADCGPALYLHFVFYVITAEDQLPPEGLFSYPKGFRSFGWSRLILFHNSPMYPWLCWGSHGTKTSGNLLYLCKKEQCPTRQPCQNLPLMQSGC